MSFSNTRGAAVPKAVHVSHVTTQQEFLRKSCDLEQSLAQEKWAEFCGGKVEESADSAEKNMWSFLKVCGVACRGGGSCDCHMHIV